MRRFGIAGVLLVAVLALASGSSVSGCSEPGDGSAEVTSTLAPAVAPAPPDLATPVSAVESYGDWISYAYRVLKSDVATHAFSVYEEVRVNSYVQLLGTERRQAIEQHLDDHEYRLVSKAESSAVVAGWEKWTYRYIDIETREYATEPMQASYDVTYTVIVEPGKGWVVDRVDAVAKNEVK